MPEPIDNNSNYNPPLTVAGPTTFKGSYTSTSAAKAEAGAVDKAVQEANAKYAPAFYDAKTQSVVLISDNIIDAEDAIKSLAHESMGHFGLQAILGNNYSKIMGEIYAGNSEIRQLADAKLKADLVFGKDLATEEVLADMQETGGPAIRELKGIEKLYNMIRNFLKRIGLPFVSDNDVAQLLADARNYVISGSEAKPGSNALLQSLVHAYVIILPISPPQMRPLNEDQNRNLIHL
jgi:hypothetical protein